MNFSFIVEHTDESSTKSFFKMAFNFRDSLNGVLRVLTSFNLLVRKQSLEKEELRVNKLLTYDAPISAAVANCFIIYCLNLINLKSILF